MLGRTKWKPNGVTDKTRGNSVGTSSSFTKDVSLTRVGSFRFLTVEEEQIWGRGIVELTDLDSDLRWVSSPTPRTFLGAPAPSRHEAPRLHPTHHRGFIGVKRVYFKGSLRFRGNNGPNEKLYFVGDNKNVFC